MSSASSRRTALRNRTKRHGPNESFESWVNEPGMRPLGEWRTQEYQLEELHHPSSEDTDDTQVVYEPDDTAPVITESKCIHDHRRMLIPRSNLPYSTSATLVGPRDQHTATVVPYPGAYVQAQTPIEGDLQFATPDTATTLNTGDKMTREDTERTEAAWTLANMSQIDQRNKDGPIVDRYAEVVTRRELSNETDGTKNGSTITARSPAFSTLNITVAQDAAVLAANNDTQIEEAAWILANMPKCDCVHKTRKSRVVKLPVAKRVPKLTDAQLEDLLTLPDTSSVPIETEGYLRGQKGFDIDAAHYETFTKYATDKLAVYNPGNCNGERLAAMYDAMWMKDRKLMEAGRVDEHGHPLTEAGNLYVSDRARGQIVRTWYDEAMATLDR